jgi:hypothetical protein
MRCAAADLPPVTSLPLQGEKQHVRTICLCCRVAFSSPVKASQILAEKSADPVAASVAVGSKAHDQTAPYMHHHIIITRHKITSPDVQHSAITPNGKGQR